MSTKLLLISSLIILFIPSGCIAQFKGEWPDLESESFFDENLPPVAFEVKENVAGRGVVPAYENDRKSVGTAYRKSNLFRVVADHSEIGINPLSKRVSVNVELTKTSEEGVLGPSLFILTLGVIPMRFGRTTTMKTSVSFSGKKLPVITKKGSYDQWVGWIFLFFPLFQDSNDFDDQLIHDLALDTMLDAYKTGLLKE